MASAGPPETLLFGAENDILGIVYFLSRARRLILQLFAATKYWHLLGV
jgi:hypothetical protein